MRSVDYLFLPYMHRVPDMSAAGKLTTTMSTKGQVIVPVEIRRRRHWDAGTRLVVEDTPEGVVLKPASLFQPTQQDEAFEYMSRQSSPKTIDEMNTGIGTEIRQPHGRGRY
jgi:AbrB family looped-hinge helix DNA binding protein